MRFEFQNRYSQKPNRVVLLGTSGIISKNLQKKLTKSKTKFIKIGRSQTDLRKKKSKNYLKKIIKKDDVIIFIAAEAPVKNKTMFKNNIKICDNICSSLIKKNISFLIYLSSDAVYSDLKEKISEKSLTKPLSLHGKMHLRREKILRSKFKNRLCILRPTLIYGPHDSHDGYGPNRFVKLGVNKKNIVLFGNGEEKRDHVHVNDVVSVIMFCIFKRANGVLNIASGKVNSFLKIAELVNKLTKNKKKIQRIKRAGPMPHNGYRPFKVNLLKNNFKKLKITNIKQGIKSYIPQI